MKSPSLIAPPSAWARWLEICDAIEHPDFEMTGEEFANFHAHFLQLRRLGVPFDPSFTSSVEEFARQMIRTDEDSDADDADSSLQEDSDLCEDLDLRAAYRVMGAADAA